MVIKRVKRPFVIRDGETGNKLQFLPAEVDLLPAPWPSVRPSIFVQRAAPSSWLRLQAQEGLCSSAGSSRNISTSRSPPPALCFI